MSDRPMHTVPGLYQKLEQIYAEGERLINEGQLQAAVEKFSEGLALDDHFRQRYVTMYAQRGFAHQRLGNVTEAVEDYSRAIEMEPPINQAQYHFHRGMCFGKMEGMEERAVEDYTRSIELYPDHPGPYHLRGKLLVDVFERYKDAIGDFDRLAELAPHPEGYQLRGFSKYMLKDYDGAAEDLAKSSELRPDPYNDYLAACVFAAAEDVPALVAAMQRTLAADKTYLDAFGPAAFAGALPDDPLYQNDKAVCDGVLGLGAE